MKYYFVKISCPNPNKNNDSNHFGSIVERLFNNRTFTETLTNIPNKLNEANVNDLIFLQLGGDSANKRSYFSEEKLQQFTNGIYGIGRLTSIYPEEKKITVLFFSFAKPITKNNLYFYPQFIDNLGASTKGIPNQAGLYELEEDVALSFIDFIKLNKLEGISDEIISNINSENMLTKIGAEYFNNEADFNTNSTLDILSHFSEKSVRYDFDEETQNEDFDVTKFISDINRSGLVFSEKTIFRFISSLLSKRFLLLTGLSGSGKTKLAQCFVKWITENNFSIFLLLKEALQSDRILQNYTIHSISPDYIEIINISGSTGKIIPLPTMAIYEWYNSFINEEIDKNDDPKEKRHEIGEKSIYQKYIHGFYSELFKISSVMYEINPKITDNCIEQYKIISVGADWTNRDQLIGFPNAMSQAEYVFPDTGALNLILDAINNPSRPFFLILDEMNMSHVERYFSDFLSAMESNDKIHLHDKNELLHILPKNILLPKNLYIIGTVNIDETTYMFSPKVLDRANVLEFRVNEDEMKAFFNEMQEVNIDVLSGEGLQMSKSFLDLSQIYVLDESQKLKDELIPFFNKLQEAGVEFGYRTASEISTFIKKCSDLVNGEMNRNEIVDAAIMQKLLPKLHGSRNKIERILKDLGMLCLENSDNQDFSESAPQKIKYPVSYEKLQRMHKRVIADGFTSYAEA